MAILAIVASILTLSCAALSGDETPQSTSFAEAPNGTLPTVATPKSTVLPIATPQIIRRSTPFARPTTQRRSIAPTALPSTATPVPTPTPVANTQGVARNLVWAYLTRCVSLDPNDLTAIPVRQDWFVKAQQGGSQNYGTWKVDSISGILEPYDSLAREWQAVVDSECSVEELAILAKPTPTPTLRPSPTVTRTPWPTPTPTLVLRSSTEAIATLWAYLVKCFPTLSVSDLESTLDPPTGEYIVKDKVSNVYGVWRVNRTDGAISADNDRARTRDQTVRGGSC